MSHISRGQALKEVQRRIDYLTDRLAQRGAGGAGRNHLSAELTERAALRWLLDREIKRGPMSQDEAVALETDRRAATGHRPLRATPSPTLQESK